ncbi:preprotein translocase subunit SecG [Candidatus Daviesbacteria bacterium]|nr:preprotein translocase subunit SecG [Candidatus Daviesbacteria bacterium]
MVKQFFYLIQIILAIILVALILLQSRGSGIGTTFGGDMGFYGTKRGAEKLLFILTIIIASVFLIVSTISVIL